MPGLVVVPGVAAGCRMGRKLLAASAMHSAVESGPITEDFFDALASRVLAGEAIDHDAAQAILGCDEADLPALLASAYRLREHFHGRRVKICQLRNARSGLCPEDCNYCSQSAISEAAIPRYRLDAVDELLAGARRAVESGAKRYCMVTSGRGPSDNDIARFTNATRAIKSEYPDLEICVSLGIMSEDQARDLKSAGVGWVNHNLNTSRRFHSEICSTHTYEDRVSTVRNVQRAGLNTCCGGIIGMGEDDADIIDLAFSLRELQVTSLPLNFLIPIDGTPLAEKRELDPGRCLRALCLMRFTNPAAEIRIAGGSELNLGWFNAVALYVANSMFVDGYLTTPGQAHAEARRMIESIGFEVEV